VIESVPTGSVVVVKPAEFPLKETFPRLVLPLLNVTMPVAVPPYFPETVAVKVTDCPEAEGFTDETNAVEELAWLTVWVTEFGELPVKFKSPL